MPHNVTGHVNSEKVVAASSLATSFSGNPVVALRVER